MWQQMPAIHEVQYFGPSNQTIPLFKTFIQIAAIMVQSRVFFFWESYVIADEDENLAEEKVVCMVGRKKSHQGGISHSFPIIMKR